MSYSVHSFREATMTESDKTVTNGSSPGSKNTEPWWIITAGPGKNCGYVVKRLKDLPKLHKAVWKDDLQRVKTVLFGLKKTMYIDYFDKEHRTALHFACARGHDGMVRAIAAAGANPNIADGHGSTTLHKAVESGNYSSVQHLLNSGADPNVIDELGRTPLHIAAKNDNTAVVDLLLERGARIDIVEKDGLTALHVATLNGNQDVVLSISEYFATSDSDTDEDLVVIGDDYDVISNTSVEVSQPQSRLRKMGGDCSSSSSSVEDIPTCVLPNEDNCSQSSTDSDYQLIFDTDDDDSSVFSVDTLSVSDNEDTSSSSLSDEDLSSSSSSEDTSESDNEVDDSLLDTDDVDEVNVTNQVEQTDVVQVATDLVSETEKNNLTINNEENIVNLLKEESDNDQTLPNDKSNAISSSSEEEVLSDNDTEPDIVELTDYDDVEEILLEELDETIFEDEPVEVAAKKLALLNSFNTLVASAIEVAKQHQHPDLRGNCPLYEFSPPLVFNWKDVALHILHTPIGIPTAQYLHGLCGKSVALAWVDPREMIAADPIDSDSMKLVTSPCPPMRLIGMGVMRGVDVEQKLFFVSSSDCSPTHYLSSVNTIALNNPEPPNGYSQDQEKTAPAQKTAPTVSPVSVPQSTPVQQTTPQTQVHHNVQHHFPSENNQSSAHHYSMQQSSRGTQPIHPPNQQQNNYHLTQPPQHVPPIHSPVQLIQQPCQSQLYQIAWQASLMRQAEQQAHQTMPPHCTPNQLVPPPNPHQVMQMLQLGYHPQAMLQHPGSPPSAHYQQPNLAKQRNTPAMNRHQSAQPANHNHRSLQQPPPRFRQQPWYHNV